VFRGDFGVYGARKSGGICGEKASPVARAPSSADGEPCPPGLVREARCGRTISDKACLGPLDHVTAVFPAVRPNPLWVSDFSCRRIGLRDGVGPSALGLRRRGRTTVAALVKAGRERRKRASKRQVGSGSEHAEPPFNVPKVLRRRRNR